MRPLILRMTPFLSFLPGLASCASVPPPRLVYIFHGSDDVLAGFMAAASACGCAGIEKTIGSHIESIVVLQIPRPITPQYRCVLGWANDHKGEGLTNRPRS